MPRGILGGLAICTVIYMIVGAVATGLVPYTELRASDPLSRAFDVAGLSTLSWIIALGATVWLTGLPASTPSRVRDGYELTLVLRSEADADLHTEVLDAAVRLLVGAEDQLRSV